MAVCMKVTLFYGSPNFAMHLLCEYCFQVLILRCENPISVDLNNVFPSPSFSS